MRPSTSDVLLLVMAAMAFVAAVAYASAEPLPIEAPSVTAPAAAPPAIRPAVVAAEAGDATQLTALAEGGDAEAQAQLGNLYFHGIGGAKPDHKAARKWFEKAAAQGHAQANRTLGEMWAKGQGGRKNMKKAMTCWIASEKAGDPLAATLVADQLFSEITGGKAPGPGQFAFRGGIPVGDVDTAIAWYREAEARDPRPEARERAVQALNALETFRKAAAVTVKD